MSTRRLITRATLWMMVVCLSATAAVAAEPSGAALDIGSRRELFVDHYLIDRLDGASLRLHEPQPAETVLQFDQPYEGVYAGYVTVLKDGETYRMYYRGLPAVRQGEALHSTETEVTCYAESPDGITWTRPQLGLFEVGGNRENNVILARNVACHNFSPLVDARPGVPPDQRLKAVGGNQKSGLLAFISADGIHWKPLRDQPIITQGAFDSQNVVFWSPSEACYVCCFRTFKKIGTEGFRWISRTTSKDFLTWTPPEEMSFGDAPPEHFYTNQTNPHYRAPHLLVSVFARFMPGRQVLTAGEVRELSVVGDYGRDCSDACFMTSRGGTRYDRVFMEGFIRPGRGAANWTSRTNYPALGIVPTPDGRMSLYVQRHYAQPSHHLQRLTLRPDGFVSVKAPYGGGELTTKPLIFSGDSLVLNLATSAAGEVRVEIQDAEGKPLPGYGIEDCDRIIGDDLERAVTWKGRTAVDSLRDRPVRLRFALKDADLYALQFR